jgi:hypothetical protein
MEDSNAFKIKSRVDSTIPRTKAINVYKNFGSLYSTRSFISPEYWNIREQLCKSLTSTVSFRFQETPLVSVCYLRSPSWFE